MIAIGYIKSNILLYRVYWSIFIAADCISVSIDYGRKKWGAPDEVFRI
jgi:hypothetical protein